MKKSDKKLENSIRESLTEVCEVALVEVEGFKWLTHLVNYSNFPGSLRVVCVFDTDDDLSNAMLTQKDEYLSGLIEERLGAAGIKIKRSAKQITFDTEEACTNQHGGRWNERLG